MAITQFSRRNVDIDLGVAAQAFYYTHDANGEITFLMANRSIKTFGKHTGPTGSGGMKDDINARSPFKRIFGKRYEADRVTLKREYLEEADVLSQTKKGVAKGIASWIGSFKSAKSAFDRTEQQRLNLIGRTIDNIFQDFGRRFTLIHSQIHNPHNPRYDSTHDNYYACELTPQEFKTLADNLVNHEVKNNEVASFQTFTAAQLLATTTPGTIPPIGFMSLELENYAIVKLLHRLEPAVQLTSSNEDIPTLRIDQTALQSATPVISHGIRRIRAKGVVLFAEVVEYNEQGKLVVTGDRYQIPAHELGQYEPLIADEKADLYRKTQDQEPTLLLPHIVTKRSKIVVPKEFVLGKETLFINPGERIVIRPGGKVEVVPESVVIKDYTYLQLPARYGNGAAPSFRTGQAPPAKPGF